MNVLSKDVKYYTYYPKPVLQIIPAYSYTEYRYSTPQSNSYGIDSTIKVTLNPPTTRQPGTNEYITIIGDKPGESLSIYGSSKVNNGNPPIRVIVKVPQSYSWITPTPYLKEYNIIGWDGGAVSKKYFVNYGEAEFSIDVTSVGVVVGLTPTNDAVTNAHYNLIRYAYYGSLGKYYIFVNGSDVGVPVQSFTSDTIFKIIVGSSGVRFLVDGVDVYFYPGKTELSTYSLDTSLYSSLDKVLNASITQKSYAEIGTIASVSISYVIINGTKYTLTNNKILLKDVWYSIESSGYVFINSTLYIVHNNKIFVNGLYVPIINGTVTILGVSGSTYNIIYEPILIIDSNVYSVFTELLQVNTQEYPNGYWVLGLDSKLLSKDYSCITGFLELQSKLEPFYNLTSELTLSSNLMYKGGSYISSGINIGSSIYTEYGLLSNLQIGSSLCYVGYSRISSELKISSKLSAGGLMPAIPPKLVGGFEIGSSLRNYFSEDPSIFVIL